MGDTAATPVVPPKPFWTSKTLWLNAVIAALAFFPQAQTVVQAHPEVLTLAFAAANFVLRLVTKSGVQLSDS